MQKIHFFILFIGLVAALGCGPSYSFEQTHQLKPTGWAYADSVNFDFEITDTTRLYNLHLSLGAADTFPSQNVYLMLSTRFPNGMHQQVARSFDIFNDKGEPMGKCSGGNCIRQLMLQENTFFNQVGRYRITVGQHSRQEPLRGMSSVGIAIEPQKPKG
jgi:gliding motility-associated lipoprotein GldH